MRNRQTIVNQNLIIAMKHLFYLIPLLIVVLLLALKPSDTECKSHFKETAKSSFSDYWLKKMRQSRTQTANSLFFEQDMNYISKSAEKDWESAISIEDKFFYKRVLVGVYGDSSKLRYYGLLNTFF